MRRERQTNQAENRAYLRKVQIIGFKEKDIKICFSFSRIVFASEQRKQTITIDLLETLIYLFFRFTIYGASLFQEKGERGGK